MNVKDKELEDMFKEASGPINSPCSSTSLERSCMEQTQKIPFSTPLECLILRTRVMYTKTSQVYSRLDKPSTILTVKQMFQSSTTDPAGNVEYKYLCYIITHKEEQEE
ncbi:unnamed protein product [Coregonus sp. 'balchen']|nr:unnamed protein product [Coregonus sp. 'balchen']